MSPSVARARPGEARATFPPDYGDNEDMVKASKLLPIGAACAVAIAIATGCASTPPTTTPDGEGSTSGADASTGSGESATTGGDSGHSSGGDEGTTVGKKAVELNGATFVQGDGPKNFADAKGKVVILDFWGTYCEPCKESFPKYQAMVEQFGGDLVIIAVSEDEPDESVDKLKKFAEKAKAKFVILWDKEKTIAKVYDPQKMPTAFIIDKEGKIANIHAGYAAGEEKKIADEVKALLK